jgi:hypothetical protein
VFDYTIPVYGTDRATMPQRQLDQRSVFRVTEV